MSKNDGRNKLRLVFIVVAFFPTVFVCYKLLSINQQYVTDHYYNYEDWDSDVKDESFSYIKKDEPSVNKWVIVKLPTQNDGETKFKPKTNEEWGPLSKDDFKNLVVDNLPNKTIKDIFFKNKNRVEPSLHEIYISFGNLYLAMENFLTFAFGFSYWGTNKSSKKPEKVKIVFDRLETLRDSICPLLKESSHFFEEIQQKYANIPDTKNLELGKIQSKLKQSNKSRKMMDILIFLLRIDQTARLFKALNGSLKILEKRIGEYIDSIGNILSAETVNSLKGKNEGYDPNFKNSNALDIIFNEIKNMTNKINSDLVTIDYFIRKINVSYQDIILFL